MIKGALKNICFKVSSALTEVKPTTERLLSFLRALELDASDTYDMRLCLEEALINAIKYGNKFQKDLSVEVICAYNQNEIFLSVEDQGQGYDPSKIKDPTDCENIENFSGRGVYLIRHLMDRLDFNEKANRIEMVKHYQLKKKDGKEVGK
jgi:serine/threonine-protein kinase RsbW